MVDIDVYEINDEEYYLMGEELINGSVYLYLSKVDDEEIFMFRKRDVKDENILHTLDNDEEVKLVSLVFANKLLQK